MEDILKRYNPWWESPITMPGIIRGSYLTRLEKLLQGNEVVFIIGIRRAGKTTLMHQMIAKTLERLATSHVLYFSMDHPVLTDLSIQDVLDGHRRIHNLSFDDDLTVFIDEVHLRPGFERELKSLHDMGHVKVFASGSSSIFLLQKGAFLTGRQRFVEVFPFSFTEYLELKGLKVKGLDAHLYIRHAEDYVREGGMPEYIRVLDPEYITTLLDSVIYKDIAYRYSISNVAMLKDALVLLSQNTGGRVSLRKMANLLGISHESVRDTLSHFQETNLVHMVEQEGKISVRKANPKKIYLADTGIVSVLTPTVNLGSLVENVVFNTLRKSGEVRYVLVGDKEVDFLQSGNAFEVKYKDALRPEDLENLTCLKGVKRRVMITRSVSKVQDGVEIIPLHKFLREQGT